METLEKIAIPKIIQNYKFGEWTITITEEYNSVYNDTVYGFYLTGLSITEYMFGIPKHQLFQSFEELILNNLEEYITFFKKEYDHCDEIENPFDDEELNEEILATTLLTG